MRNIALNKLFYISLPACLFLAGITLSGCFKDTEENFYFRDFQVEFNNAVLVNNAPDKNYPLLTSVRSGAGVVSYQVNLNGGQKNSAQTIKFKVITEETTAVEGMHYRLPQGDAFVIDAGKSFGSVDVEILTFPAAAGTVVLVLELVGNEEIKASENYKRIGIPIRN